LSETHLDPEILQFLETYLAIGAPLAEAGDRLAAFAAEAGLDLAGPLALFAARAAAIGALMPTDTIRFAGGFGRPLDYYTGLVFQIAAAGSDAPVAGGGLGLALFLRKGMAVWMEAWRCCASRGEQGSRDAPSLANRVPLPVQTELVTILAAMAWHSVQEMMQ